MEMLVFLFTWPVVTASLVFILLIAVGGMYWYVRRRNILWKNESAAFIHTEAIVNAIDEVPETIVVTNKEGFIIYANSTSATMFGLKESQLLEKNVYQVIPREFYDVVEKAKRENHKELFEIIGRNRHGHEFPLEVTVSRKDSATGSYSHTFILKDISHRKKGEATKLVALNDFKKDCELLAFGETILRAGSWQWDLSKDPDEVSYSKGFAKIFDLHVGHIIPASKLMECVYIADRDMVNKKMLEAMEKSTGYELEYRITKRNGRKDLVKCVALPGLTENGKLIKLTGTVQLIKENVN